MARLRKTGRSLEEAEDFVHELYAETLGRVPNLSLIDNLGAWFNKLFTRRVTDLWRREQTYSRLGGVDMDPDVLDEIMVGLEIDPMEAFVQDELLDALYEAIDALPTEQKLVIREQLFNGKTFQQLSEETGIGIDTLAARKRYGIQKLTRALGHWLQD